MVRALRGLGALGELVFPIIRPVPLAAAAGREGTLALVVRVAAPTMFYRGVLALEAVAVAVRAISLALCLELMATAAAAFRILAKVPVEVQVSQVVLAALWAQHPPASREQRLGLVERAL